MKTVAIVILLLSTPMMASADLNILACEPEWAALADELGGDLVKTSSATNALQDPHYIQARPSLISKVRQADLIVCSGAQLEIGWLPMLLRKGNNPDVLPGTPGFLEASSFVKRLDITANTDRSQGDVHPQGNPHIQTNPHNIRLVAEAMSERMAQLDAGNSDFYRQRLVDFKKRWNNAVTGWEERATPLHGRRVIAHHKSWVYLQDWLGWWKSLHWSMYQAFHQPPPTWPTCWIVLLARGTPISLSAHRFRVKNRQPGFPSAPVFRPLCCP